MKKVFWIKPIIFVAILLFIATGCKKEKTYLDSGELEYKVTHWPAVRTLVATNVDSTTAKLTGIVNGYGLSTTITFEYDITTSYGNSVTAIQSPVTGDSITHVSADISGLIPNMIYHYRIKAENSKWINFYGSEKIFYTGPNVIDVDSNIYHTIKIGSQVWMKENLKTTRYADGSAIPLVTDNWNTLGFTDKAFCWFNNDSASNAGTYGALYTWSAAMNGAASSSSSLSGVQGVCPTGWHLPSHEEWLTLKDYLGGDDLAGGKLKEQDTLHWNSPNVGATNESGFTALPGGRRSYNGQYLEIGYEGFWWSSTECTSDIIRDYFNIYHTYPVWSSWIYNYSSEIELWPMDKEVGLSVRCVKDPIHN